MKMIRSVNWAIILWASVSQGLLAGRSRLKPMVPTIRSWFMLFIVSHSIESIVFDCCKKYMDTMEKKHTLISAYTMNY